MAVFSKAIHPAVQEPKPGAETAVAPAPAPAPATPGAETTAAAAATPQSRAAAAAAAAADATATKEVSSSTGQSASGSTAILSVASHAALEQASSPCETEMPFELNFEWADWWLQKRYGEVDKDGSKVSVEDVKAAAKNTVAWLRHALPKAHANASVKKKIKELLAHEYFTKNLTAFQVFDELKQDCRMSALALGEEMDRFFIAHDLHEKLGSLPIAVRAGFQARENDEHPSRDVLRQDNKQVGAPFQAILNLSATNHTPGPSATATDSIAAMILRLVALMLDGEFQQLCRRVTEANEGTFKATEPKGHARMINKAHSRLDHLCELTPRPMMNIDIVRNALTFDSVAHLVAAVQGLEHCFGAPVRVKNMFAFDRTRAQAQFHYRTLMLNWLYDARCTYGELVRRPANVALLDAFKEAAPWNPNEPWGRWRRQAHIAVNLLRSEEVASLPARMICETQLLLREYLHGRQKMHLLYKICRAADHVQLHADFMPKTQGIKSYGEVQTVALEEARRLVASGRNTKEVLLYSACQQGHMLAAQELLTAGADANAGGVGHGSTPLHVASESGFIEIVELLVKAGADVNRSDTDMGITPLFAASSYGHSDVVNELLAAGADANYIKHSGVSSLYIASQFGYLEIVQALLAAGADVGPTFSATPLFIASLHGHVEIVEALIRAGANVNCVTTDQYGNTPLLKAAQFGHVQVVRLLLDAGANVRQARERDGCTPLMAATHGGHEHVMSLLTAAGAPELQ